jgi:insertion element IS1 protein InsB
VLHISYGTVYQWVKQWKGHLESPDRNERIAVVELDRYGKRNLSFVCGDRSTKTGLKLWDKVKELDICFFASDHWKSYEEFVSSEKHLQTKAETFTVEEYNSRIRHYPTRFKRKIKCYSKATFMIETSLYLLMMKLNNELSILN